MTVLFDQGGVKIWTDGFSPVIFVKFSEMPADRVDTQSFSKKSKSLLHTLVSRFQNVYSVIDLSDCGSKSSESLLNFCFSHFPELLCNEIKFLAFVTSFSHKCVVKAQLDKIVEANPHLQCENFHDFFIALNKINSLRQEQIALS